MNNRFDSYRLSPTLLTLDTNSDTLPIDSTQSPNMPCDFGQERAMNAIKTALDIHANGYHVFAVGDTGLGKRTIISQLLHERAKHEPTPADWVYVHNFDEPRKPLALMLASGQGLLFAKDMHKLWHTLYQKILHKFSSINYQNSLNAIKHATQKQERLLIDEMNAIANTHNLSFVHSATQKAILVPLDANQPVCHTAIDKLQKKLTKISIELDNLDHDANEQINQLHETLITKIITPLITPILTKYTTQQNNQKTINPKAIEKYLQDYKNDIIANSLFIVEDDEDFMVKTIANIPNRYYVNVLVSHTPNSGAPVVFEDMPTHANLLGHIEYTTQLGTVLTDSSMIRAGALHKANGGYLFIDAASLLEHPYAWQGLKHALHAKKLQLSSLEQMLTLTGSVSLEPDGIDLSIKVIILGELELYYDLLEFDPEFHNIFKIRADFNDTLPRNHQSELFIAHKINTIIKDHQLPMFDNTALAMIITQLAVYADDQNKLDLHHDKLLQLVLESAHHYELDCHTKPTNTSQYVNKTHVKKALDGIKERTGYLKELYWQELKNEQQLINTTGFAIGQINALTVISHIDSQFGLPAKLTAVVAPKFGNGEILDIESDVQLGGSLHAKGVLIMTSFLRSLFSDFSELNFSASLAFEQSYSHIDGDSATLAECVVLLSALANTPINQSIAITGSMNQLGQAQAIGGVNEKIMGFFDICYERGLTGEQGVIIPKTNIKQLMLPDEIIEAVANHRFHIYAIDTIYDALLILNNIPIHTTTKKGKYRKNTLFAKVVHRLISWQDKKNQK